ncbi:MAG: LysR family transcriptional regulator [Acidobacteria bacterium]|nr:LysR family transcriptional regulator [Acidobacteriota bacterium]
MNLLVAFDALMAERSVTRAARRLGLSQPAVSNALARLRLGVGDPLFARTRRGIEPTARAVAMAGPVRSAITTLRQALLDPSSAGSNLRLVTVAANEYARRILLSDLAADARSMPEEVVFDIRDPGVHQGEAPLLTIDWASSARAAILLRDSVAYVYREISVPAGTTRTLEWFLACRHVAVDGGEADRLLDAALAATNRTRRLTFRAPGMADAAAMVAGGDLIAVLPRRFAERLAPGLGLSVSELPLDVATLILMLDWTPNGVADPVYRWLNARLIATGRALSNRAASETHRRT